MSKEEIFIVAEMGASHHQDFNTACDIIRASAWAGASAVKVQLFTPDQMTLDCTEPDFIIRDGPWRGLKMYDLYDAAYMPLEWYQPLSVLAKDLGLSFFTSVYHPDTVNAVDTPIYKIASFEINYPDLIEAVAKTKKPVFISTGMAEYGEIKEAVKAVRKYHNDITLLHCISEYPATVEQMNLKTIVALERGFKVKVGLSDHTTGTVTAVTSVPLGVRVIEKHIKVDDIGLDSFAVYPEQFRVMTETVRAAEKALGEVIYGGRKRFRRKEIEGKMLRTEECLKEKQS